MWPILKEIYWRLVRLEKMNDLLSNINEVHTTPLGIIRIKKNLKLETEDVVNWCKRKIKEADKILRNGKNWYVYIGDNIITINVKSHTIITVHKINRSSLHLHIEFGMCKRKLLRLTGQ